MFDLTAIQKAVASLGFDGWLLYDFRGLNVLARRIIELPTDTMLSRRWFYFIPAKGEPRKLVHQIEPHALDSLPGSAQIYLRWQELEAGVHSLVAGSVELVRSFGVEVLPSGDLVQMFEACWDDDQWAMHLEAAQQTRSAYDIAFGFIADRVRHSGSVQET